MNSSGQSYKKRNRQWRAIIWISLFLIFGKTLGIWTYRALGIDQVYSATTAVVSKVGLAELTAPPAEPQLVINVKNDTPSDYTIDTKVTVGRVDFLGKTLIPGETRRFTVKPPVNNNQGTSAGDIIFLSAPSISNNNTTCQELHTLGYDLSYAKRIKQPLNINLSAINSRLDCQNQ